VTVLPDDSQRVGADGYHIGKARGLRVAELGVEHFRVGFRFHILMSAAAGGTRAGRAQQFEGIDARVPVVPRDSKFFFALVGCNAGWFFVHYDSP